MTRHRHITRHTHEKTKTHDKRNMTWEIHDKTEMRDKKRTVYRPPATRQAYRQTCRKAGKLITESCSLHFCSEMVNTSDNPHLLWRTVSQMLHPHSDRTWYNDLDKALATRFHFFVDKVRQMKLVIKGASMAHPNPIRKPCSISSSATLESCPCPCNVWSWLQDFLQVAASMCVNS